MNFTRAKNWHSATDPPYSAPLFVKSFTTRRGDPVGSAHLAVSDVSQSRYLYWLEKGSNTRRGGCYIAMQRIADPLPISFLE